MKKPLKKINKTLQKYQPLIQSIGILCALGILVLTCNTTELARDSLYLAIKQEKNKELPIWDWEINDSIERVKLRPFNSEIKIQIANATFPGEIFKDSPQWPLNQPEFELYLSMFKIKMSELFKKQNEFTPGFATIVDRSTYPFVMEIEYIQFGERRKVTGVFVIQYRILRITEYPQIILDGVLFDHYLKPGQSLKNTIESMEKSIEK